MLRVRRATASYLAALHTPGQLWAHVEPPSEGVALGVTVAARVCHGQWIVDCPWCNSAQYANPNHPQFLCVECANNAVKGGWVAVDWPDDLTAIEQALGGRPAPHNQNWWPGETVDDLHRENRERGVA